MTNYIRVILLGLLLAAAAPAHAQQFTSYVCQHKSCEQVAGILRPLLPEASTASPSVQLVVDRDRNRVLLSGPEAVHRLARRVLDEVDRPLTFREPQAVPPSSETMRVYHVDKAAQADFMREVQRLSGNSLRLSHDPQTQNVFITANGIAHQRIEQLLSELSRRPERPTIAAATPEQGAAGISPPSATHPRFVRVPPARLDRLQQQIAAIFGTRLRVKSLPNRQIYLLDTQQQPPTQLELEFDRTRSGVLVGGPAKATDQMVILIEALARDESRSGRRSQVFRLKRNNHGKLRDLIHRSSQLGLPGRPALAQRPQGSVGRIGVSQPESNQPRIHRFPTPGNDTAANDGVAWVRYLFQEEQDNAGGEGNDSAGQQVEVIGAQPDLGRRPFQQFEGVDVESLPDLDVIILRGSDQDLEQLAEIVQQIERISKETQPEVQLYQLQHAQSEAVVELINEVNEDLTSGRQGRAAVVSLVKPNAILVIGWGDAVEAIIVLIRQLDQPVSPESQSAVFRIKYASATAVEQTLQTFFANRPGLGPRVEIVADQRTNSLVVYAAPRDLAEVKRLVVDLDRPDGAAVNRARVFQIENSLAADVAETLQQAIQAAVEGGDRSAVLELQTFDEAGQRILRSGTLQSVRITPNERNNTIIVSSPEENLELIAELIRQVDTPGSQAKIKVFRIFNGDAASLIETLRSLIPAEQGSAGGPQLSSAAGEPNFAPLRFSLDSRSNSILATGSEGDLRIVEALLAKLDQSTSMVRKTLVYSLKNSPAIDVATAVNQYLISRRQIETAVPGQRSPFEEIEREVVVVPEPVANKLILAATPRYYEEIKSLIEKLDEQPPQVLIQVLIAEVALNNADEFGVELGLQDSVLFDRSLLGDLLTTTNSTAASTNQGVITTTQELIRAATNAPGFGFNSVQPLGNSGSESALNGSDFVGGQGLSNFAVGRANDALGFGGLVLSASSRNVSVLLRALRESRRVDILSRPQIRTLDNQPALIQVGQRVPRIVGSTVNQNGQSNAVTLENVGLIVGVTPRVSPDGTVVMEIDAEKSKIGPEQEGIPVAVSIDGTVVRSPRVDTTTAQATVSAADGETIVLGGLITKDEGYTHRSVPWLGEIPIIEHLFRFDSNISRRTELLIILTPHVIRSAADSERLRQAEMAKMSWCASDVYNMMDDIDYFPESQLSNEIEAGEPEVIYPDLNPSGMLDRVEPPLPDAALRDLPSKSFGPPLNAVPE